MKENIKNIDNINNEGENNKTQNIKIDDNLKKDVENNLNQNIKLDDIEKNKIDTNLHQNIKITNNLNDESNVQLEHKIKINDINLIKSENNLKKAIVKNDIVKDVNLSFNCINNEKENLDKRFIITNKKRINLNNEFLKSKLFTKENEKNLFRSNLIFDSISQ